MTEQTFKMRKNIVSYESDVFMFIILTNEFVITDVIWIEQFPKNCFAKGINQNLAGLFIAEQILQ